MAEPTDTPRVLHVNTARSWRGGEQQMVHLLRGMRERGLRAEAVCQRGAPAAQRARAAGAGVHEVRMRAELDLCAAAEIARIARRSGVQILHAHTAHAHSLALLAKMTCFAGARLVVHRRSEFRPGRGALGLGPLKYRVGVDAWIAISDRLREILISVGVQPWRVFTVRSVTDPARFIEAKPNPDLRRELDIPDDALVVGNIGYLVPHKDHVNLVEAAAVAMKQLPEMWVVIVGSGPLQEQIEQRACELGIADRVVLTGYRDDIPQLIRMFDLFALSSSEEGICSTLMDVMASRRPIVATDAAGVREAVLDGETGIIVPIRNAEALGEAIVKMAGDPERARRMVEAGLRRVTTCFTVDTLTEGTLEVYRRVLAGQVRPDASP